MQTKKVGNSTLEVTPICLGGNVFGWTIDEATSFTVLDAFVSTGGNFIDTANAYSTWVPGNHGGESETIIGKWVKQRGNRDNIIIATKVGSQMPNGKGLSRSYILKAVEESLQRLQTDYIDLYQSHYDDPDTPIEETLEAYATLVQQGKVRAIGASNFTATRLSQALQISQQHHYPRYESIQPLYNLYDRESYEKELASLCAEQHIAVISYYSLASGFLSGKYRPNQELPKSARASSVSNRYLNPRGLKILTALDQVADKHHATDTQIALAWLISQPTMTAPIVSATSTAQVEELTKAGNLQLDTADLQLLDQASAY